MIILIAVAVSTLFSACGKTPPAETKASEGDAAHQGAGSIEERLAARPAWLNATDSLSAADFSKDPHGMACAACHDRAAKTDKEWKATCSSTGCHFRPWPETVFHRVELSVFNRCENCHKPHIFSLEGEDCLSCHSNLHGPEGTVEARSIEGIEMFPHARHKEFSCETCHSTAGKHASLTITSLNTCRACHHASSRSNECARCHTLAETRGPHLEPVSMTIAGKSVSRELPFDHEIHDGLDCSNCHEANTTAAPKISCMDCHEYHHQPEADCAGCHQSPPAGAHSVDVHEAGCADCHGTRGFSDLEFNRNFCASCHRDRTDHFPEKNCSICHKMTASPDGGR